MNDATLPTSLQPPAQWTDFLAREVDPYASAKYEWLLSRLGNLSGKSALVVGSGSGEFAALLARAGAVVHAIDIDPPSVELTEKTAARFGVSLTTEVATLQNFNAATTYDVVAATDVIEHITDDVDASERLMTLVKPEGKVVITVPALPSLFGYHDEVLGHFRRYTRSTLLELFSRHLSNLEIRYYGLFLVPVAWTISRWLRRPYPVATVGKTSQSSGAVGRLIRLFFSWEKSLRPPLGTSLLLIGTAASK